MINGDAVFQSILYVVLGAVVFFLGAVTGCNISEGGGPNTSKTIHIESSTVKQAKHHE